MGRRPLPHVARFRLSYPRAVPAVLHHTTSRLTQSGTGGGRSDGCRRSCRSPSTRTHATCEPNRFSLNATAAFIGVLLLGILPGILLAGVISILLLLARSSTPHVAFLGRIPGTEQYSDLDRHPDNEPLIGVLACRPEASLIYLNTDHVQARILEQLKVARTTRIQTVVCDLSASPLMDLAGARMLAELSESLKDRGIELTITGAHGQVRDLLRAEGLDEKIPGIARGRSLESELRARSDAAPQLGEIRHGVSRP
jgi:anti-anti-sigma factor